MVAEDEPQPRVASVDSALAPWRQGDCAVGEQWFVHRLEKSFPVTEAGRVAGELDAELAEEQVLGLVVVTQTCDVVRSCKHERNFDEGRGLRALRKIRVQASPFWDAAELHAFFWSM